MSMVPVRRSQNWLPEIFNDFFGNEWLEKAPHVPAINILENDDEYKVEPAAPGMTKEDFNVTLDAHNQLQVRMEKKKNTTITGTNTCGANSPTPHSNKP